MKAFLSRIPFVVLVLSTTAFSQSTDMSYIRTDRGALFGVRETTQGEATFRLDPASSEYTCGALPTGCGATLTKLTPAEIATGNGREPLLNPSLKRHASVTVRICDLMERSSSTDVAIDLATLDCEVTTSSAGEIDLKRESRGHKKTLSWSVSSYPGKNLAIEAVRETDGCNIVFYYRDCTQQRYE